MNRTERQALHSNQSGLCALCNTTLPDRGAVYDKQRGTLICRRCAMLIHNSRNQARRGVTFGAFTTHEQRECADGPEHRGRMSKYRRQMLLDDQDHKCVMCDEDMSELRGCCHDPQRNVFTCYRCGMFINAWRDALKRGITFTMFADYEGTRP